MDVVLERGGKGGEGGELKLVLEPICRIAVGLGVTKTYTIPQISSESLIIERV